MILRILVAASLLMCCCCGTKREEPGDGQSVLRATTPPEPVENSGRTLEGVFVLEATEDPYALPSSPREPAMRLTFDRDGNFRRERVGRSGPAVAETGAYVIGTRNELVLYVEQIGGSQLAAAKSERYVTREQEGDSMKLEMGSRRFVLRREP